MKFSFNYKKKKVLIFISFLFLLFLIICNKFKFDAITVGEIYSSRINNDLFVNSIMSNNNLAVYSIQDNTYYFSDGLFDSNSIKILSPYASKYLIEKIDDDYYKIIIYCDDYYQERFIRILNIPIVSISTDYLLSDNYNNSDLFNGFDFNRSDSLYTNIFIEVMDNSLYDSYFSPSIYSTGKFRIRGATSSLFPKKSYKIELNTSHSILGMSSDKDWVLDALYTDKSKIRNILASEIWNSINDNQQINNDIHGRFCELFIDNEYIGLYVLKEKVDKEIVGVKQDGLIAKSYTHLNADIINNFINNDVNLYKLSDEVILGNFELKKYNNEVIDNFINRLGKYYLFKDYSSISDNFYIDNYLNYKILISFICAGDNITKNQYYSMESLDSKILITPWDMDLSFGIDYYDDSSIKSIDNFNNFNDLYLLDENIVGDMDEITFKKFKERYWELRGSYLNMEYINTILDGYKKQIIEGGSVIRDAEKWYLYDAEYEIEQVRKWCENRFIFLDQYLSL